MTWRGIFPSPLPALYLRSLSNCHTSRSFFPLSLSLLDLPRGTSAHFPIFSTLLLFFKARLMMLLLLRSFASLPQYLSLASTPEMPDWILSPLFLPSSSRGRKGAIDACSTNRSLLQLLLLYPSCTGVEKGDWAGGEEDFFCRVAGGKGGIGAVGVRRVLLFLLVPTSD